MSFLNKYRRQQTEIDRLKQERAERDADAAPPREIPYVEVDPKRPTLFTRIAEWINAVTSAAAAPPGEVRAIRIHIVDPEPVAPPTKPEGQSTTSAAAVLREREAVQARRKDEDPYGFSRMTDAQLRDRAGFLLAPDERRAIEAELARRTSPALTAEEHR